MSSSLPRGKVLALPQVVCADCGAGEPAWASLNRGVLICGECCGVHRSLGRHISQIRSLKKGAWHSSQLALIHTLYNNGANNIWEHLLLDPYGTGKAIRRKPSEADPVYPTKAEFIRAKYANLSFALRPSKEEGPLNLDDLNRQLWSCVRTSHVETALRLLALGANPNYFDPERGTSPMHVAAKEGQGLQVELLAVYGGDPSQPDFGGQTPGETARAEKHTDLAARFTELEFEATDRLTMYLCGRKPDHRSGQHFVVPEMASGALPTPAESNASTAREAKRRLRALPHSSYERLVQDVYDEVDRRETDAAWLASLPPTEGALVNERYIVPFLPVNPDFSSTRNQSRQKLAKFNAREFASLIIDVLSEAKYRFMGSSVTEGHEDEKRITPAPGAKKPSPSPEGEIEDPEYDTVASETSFELRNNMAAGSVIDQQRNSKEGLVGDDSGKLNQQRSSGADKLSTKLSSSGDSKSAGSRSHESTEELLAMLDSPEDQPEALGGVVPLDDYFELKNQLGSSEQKVEALTRSNEQILKQLTLLNSTVQCLIQENSELKRNMAVSSTENGRSQRAASYDDRLEGGASDKEDIWQRRDAKNGQLEVPGYARVRQANSLGYPSSGESVENGLGKTTPLRSQMSMSMTSEPGSSLPSRSYYTPPLGAPNLSTAQAASASSVIDSIRFPSRSRDSSSGGSGGRPAMGVSILGSPSTAHAPVPIGNPASAAVGSGPTDEFPDTVVLQTEELTRQIQGLLIDAQAGRNHAFASHAAGIQGTVDRMVGLVPANVRAGGSQVDDCLNQMVDACISLTVQCSREVGVGQQEQLSCQVVQAAYEVAKSAKLLMNLLQA